MVLKILTFLRDFVEERERDRYPVDRFHFFDFFFCEERETLFFFFEIV